MRVIPALGARSLRAPADSFTGMVWRDASPPGPSPDVRATRVTFAPGARTHWHTHPEGQVIHVITGVGSIGRDGEPPVRISPGDVVVFAPDERHWHGASPDSVMVHLAINPAIASDGSTDWQEPVTDDVYLGGS